MIQEKNRLLSLIAFAQESAKLKISPVCNVKKHPFGEFEHEFKELPGIRFNSGCEENEIWLIIDRLHPTSSPLSLDPDLISWMKTSNNPNIKPELLSFIETHDQGEFSKFPYPPLSSDAPKSILFKDLEKKDDIESKFKTYLNTQWNPWAEEEIKLRRTIQIYSQLFTIKQQLEGSIVDTQLELSWGIGIAVWNMHKVKVCHPLITQPVDLNLNEQTMALEIGPRNTDCYLELDLFVSADNPGIQDFEKAFKEFISSRTQTLSPFDHGSFEGLVRAGVRFLDSKGLYWPEHTSPDDRKLPTQSEELKVTDTWVLMARPRGKSLFIQDLERFKTELLKEESFPPTLPPPIAAVLKEPAKTNKTVFFPKFRGLSELLSNNSEIDICDHKVNDLYFPLPFNNEQAHIVQLLETYDGVVVQGPPGTGKTHTIANIIAHYLALGKRILVTSMKEPALSVLRDKIPRELRPLVISLLTNENDGMKQFEAAIGKIASELQNINQISLGKEIIGLDQKIDNLHNLLARIDRKIGDWAQKNLTKIRIDDNFLTSLEAATEIVEANGEYEWLEDHLSLEKDPEFDFSDILKLREVRRIVADDICYYDKRLPETLILPSLRDIQILHKDLSQLLKLEDSIKSGELPSLLSSTNETYQNAYTLSEQIKTYVDLTNEVNISRNQWQEDSRNLLKSQGASLNPLIDIFDSVGNELIEAIESRSSFIKRPIFSSPDTELDSNVLKAIENLSNNKKGFSFIGYLSRRSSRKKLETIRILDRKPKSVEDWQYIHSNFQLQLHLRELISRWNSVACELSVECFDKIEPKSSLKAVEYFHSHKLIRKQISLEKDIIIQSQKLLPSWNENSESPNKVESFTNLLNILENHIHCFELYGSNDKKNELQDILSNYEAPIIEEMSIFIESKLGNPDKSDMQIQKSWECFLDKIKHLNGLRTAFADIQDICDRIEISGAVKWAQKLRTVPVQGVIDWLLPDNWMNAWRLRKIATYLDKTQCRKELKKLTTQRKEAAIELTEMYQDVVTKRTWLKLAERATPCVRSALQAFRTAIAKIGKGTGKRSVRYRQDARQAAASVNNAIPCWIMPHWRISESLPSELGLFDLVIIDEASQSDLSALPALLRAQKILVVGDEKQVSPEAVGLEEEKIISLINRYLNHQVEHFRAQMTPDRSIYDLFKVVFSESSLMLKEHFRCVGPIIEYSKREFYNHELKPIRLPKASEILNPPLVDILVEDGCREINTHINMAEARVIVDEIRKICEDPKLSHRTIGIVSLLGVPQAMKIWEMIEQDLGPEAIKQHNIACGDAKTFQGKERDIVFLSMVVSQDNAIAQTKDSTAQRFNVAASRARDRMYLVRSVDLEDLSPKDNLRRKLISHFLKPFENDEKIVDDLRMKCESDFEREIYNILTEKGYRVIPQVGVNEYRIDMVVEGHNDTMLAIECDGDRFHGPDRWEADMHRQRTLERVGWNFWRCFASDFVRNRKEVIDDLISTLKQQGITPLGSYNASLNFHSEHRRVVAFETSRLIDESE